MSSKQVAFVLSHELFTTLLVKSNSSSACSAAELKFAREWDR